MNDKSVMITSKSLTLIALIPKERDLKTPEVTVFCMTPTA
jgi:hypothetical protein